MGACGRLSAAQGASTQGGHRKGELCSIGVTKRPAAHLQSEPSRHRPAIAPSAGDREDVGAGDDAELRPGEHEGHALLLRQGYGWGWGSG